MIWVDKFGRTDIFTTLSFSINEHSISLSLSLFFKSSLLSFISICNFQYTAPVYILLDLYLVFHFFSYYKWYLKHFFFPIDCWYIEIWLIFICVLILFTATLLKSLTSAIFFFLLVVHWRFSNWTNVICKYRIFIYPFQSACILFIFLDYCTVSHFQYSNEYE